MFQSTFQTNSAKNTNYNKASQSRATQEYNTKTASYISSTPGPWGYKTDQYIADFGGTVNWIVIADSTNKLLGKNPKDYTIKHGDHFIRKGGVNPDVKIEPLSKHDFAHIEISNHKKCGQDYCYASCEAWFKDHDLAVSIDCYVTKHIPHDEF